MANTSFPDGSSSLFPSTVRPLSAQVGIGILTLAFVLGFPGNLFVVWSVWCRVKKKSVTCLLVLNLAAADALVLLSAPLFIRYLSGLPLRGWEFGSAVCKLVHYLSSVNMYVSIYLICLMSADRCLAVTRPYMSQRMRTKRSLMIILLIVWLMAFILSLPMPFYRSLVQPYIHKNITLNLCYQSWTSTGHRIFQYLFETLMAFLLPFTIITVCYSFVIYRLRSAMFQRKGRGNRLILLIIGTFALFWLPYHIINTIEMVGLLHGSTTLVGAAEMARPNVTAFAYFSSAINPVLYVFAGSSHIRQAGLSFMGRLFEVTYSESRNASMASRGTRTTSRSASVPDEGSALRSLSTMLGKPFRPKHKEVGRSNADCQGAEANKAGSELMTIACIDERC